MCNRNFEIYFVSSYPEMNSRIFLVLLLSLLFVKEILNEKPKGLEVELAKSIHYNDFENLIIEILVKSLLPYKCVAIICDNTYHEVFKQNLFKQFGVYLSFIIVVVEESDDLLAPNENSQELLNMAKEQGCQFYIILLANGMQVTRLLRFGDRYRVLNTRANYMMLWDRRLFDKELHYIWKRIVNVLFIREYQGISKLGSGYKAIPWFELSTVPFPSPIKGVLVPRRLDMWKQSKFRTGIDLFRDKTSDLQNQTLKVVTFAHIPATTKIEIPEDKTVKTILGTGAMGFVGIEVEVLQTISEAMNFKPDLYEPINADIEMWGYKQTDGHYSGLIGEMVQSSADIALGDLYYTPFFLNLMDLSTPYNTECLTFLTPESLTNNSWKTLILPFNPFMWVAILVTLSTTGFIFYALQRFHNDLNKIMFKDLQKQKNEMRAKNIETLAISSHTHLTVNQKYVLMKQQYETAKFEGEPEGGYLFGEMSNSFLYTFSMLLLVSLPKLPTGWSLRMLTGWYYLYCILVVVAYKASMTAILANPAPRVTIDTLQELVDSGLACGGWGEINREFFKTSLDPTSQVIGSKFETINDSDSAIDRIAKGSFAFYENVHFLKYAAVKKQLKNHLTRSDLKPNESNVVIEENVQVAEGDHNLHIMSDCVIHMPVSIGLQKNSPIKPRVDKFIRRVFEAGLIKKWSDDVMAPTTAAEIHLAPSDTTSALMSMQKFIGALVALLVGLFLSICLLIGEIVYFEFVTKKHPHFDKYKRRLSKK